MPFAIGRSRTIIFRNRRRGKANWRRARRQRITDIAAGPVDQAPVVHWTSRLISPQPRSDGAHGPDVPGIQNGGAAVTTLRLAWTVSAALSVVVTAADRAAAQAGSAPPVVELRAGDRIAFVGDSFFERDYPRGLIETALTVAHPEKALTFRNLGWSGDTVRGESRAYFGKAADGYGELLKSVDLVKPTVIFLSYGANESFDGSAGLDVFISDYRRLLDELASRTRRLVLLTPLPADRTSSPLPAAALEERNRVLSQVQRGDPDAGRLAPAREHRHLHRHARRHDPIASRAALREGHAPHRCGLRRGCVAHRVFLGQPA